MPSFVASGPIRLPLRDYNRYMQDLSKRAFNEALQTGLTRFGFRFLKGFLIERLSKSGVQPPGGGLAVRSGELRRSFTWGVGTVSEDLIRKRAVYGTFHQGNLILRLKSDSKYAAIHEFGGTIIPKRAQYLAIPLQAARTRAGVGRGSPRMFNNTFVARSRNGNLIIFQNQGSRIVPLFVLKKEVRIPARMGLRKYGASSPVTTMRREAMKGAMTEAWNRARTSA